jgi:hypothetical protein
MPIRFRCVYCDQLLGIARRKAGAVVNCPSCARPLIVPEPAPVGVEPEALPAPNGSHPGTAPAPQRSPPPRLARQVDDTIEPGPELEPAAGVFERDDFDVLLQPLLPETAGPAPTEPPRTVTTGPSAFAAALVLEPEPPPPPAAGIVLSPAKATWLAVIAVLALAVAFAAGLFVGLLLRKPPPEKAERPALPAQAVLAEAGDGAG